MSILTILSSWPMEILHCLLLPSLMLNQELRSTASWLVDSGASDHMTGNPSLFSTFTLLEKLFWLMEEAL